jgi:DNA-binding transcriptional regulator YbjK
MFQTGQLMTTIQYQGRQARRSGSEHRRKAILEAALAIVVRDGIRNVRHRAVAKEADVPLSATTYYFKDISDLICDAFTLFAENAMETIIEPFQRQAFALLDSFDGELPKGAARETMFSTLTDMITAFLLTEVTQNRDHLIAEQAFMQEAALDSRLAELAGLYFAKQQMVMVAACKKLGTLNPELDAEFTLANLLSLERQLLLSEEPSEEFIRPRVARMLTLICGG